MTKSTITRERIQRIIRAIDSEAYDEEEIREWLSSDEIMELARIALAAMDSEPVAYIFKHPAGRLFWALTDESNKGQNDVMPVYASPQPAPVVPDDVLAALQKVARIRLDLNDFDGDRRGIADCLGDAEEALIEVVNRRAAMLAAAPQSPGSEPATVPGKWIPVSEQMPPSRHEVLVGRWWGEKPRWCCKWATYIPGHPDAQSSGWLIPGASWTPTHWMPLPAAPQEVK
ncbi:TPA: DUF551 domain-containing protein [Klebsiella pneumoniae]|nr:DUF551 domain-containing protein [Klebsiella pneumoniae]